jgi:squalene synthase HpnC
VIAQLRKSTADSPIVTRELADSQKKCKRITTSHYENFLVASVLLPRSLRQPFYDVYAFCRTADDLADESPTTQLAIEGISRYRNQIQRIYEGGQPTGLFVALANTIDKLNLPRKPFDDLLDAFVQDQSVRRYENEQQLLDYCQRSANPVGCLVLAMAGCHEEENTRLSNEICTGLQLANFWQDVARDFQIGRIYLPATVMRQFGFDEEQIRIGIKKRQTPPAVREAIAHQCTDAARRFESGMPLIARVPDWLSADIELFIQGGLATLDAIERIDYDVLRQRVRVGKLSQAWMVGRLLLKRPFARKPKLMVNTS